MARKLTREERAAIGKKALDAFKKRISLTKVSLANDAKVDEKSVRSVLNGDSASFDAYDAVCLKLDLDITKILQGLESEPLDRAPQALGGYSREFCSHYAGDYITIRPNYKDTTRVKAYLTNIDWNQGCLRFEERGRQDEKFAQKGEIYMPPNSSCLYLVTITQGWVRTVLTSQLMPAMTEMRGLILSQFNIAGPAFGPVCAPIAYIKTEKPDEAALGEFGPTDANYDVYYRILQDAVRDSYALAAFPRA